MKRQAQPAVLRFQEAMVMTGNNNIRIGTLFGIPFFVNPSWFLILGLVTWTYGNDLAQDFPTLLPGVPLVLGLVTGLLLFSSVVAHELGHSWVAIKQGIPVRSITLFLFGGVASIEKEPTTPGNAFWVSIAGPLVSFLLCGLLVVFNSFVVLPAPLMAISTVLAIINFSLGVFNLIPGLPLDGGNILKAIVWKITGNPYQGVKVASWTGQAFGALAILSGLIPLLNGNPNRLWNILVGWFLIQNARSAGQFARVQSRLDGLVVIDAVSAHSPIVSADASLRDFVDLRTLQPGNWRKFLVVDATSKLVGEVNVDVLQGIPGELWASKKVGAVMEPIEPTTTIEADSSLMAAIEQLEKHQLSELTVIQADGSLVGLVEKVSIIDLIQQRSNIISV
jgi:Zn-dependent protease/predicted transcriptional regulator